MFLKTIEQKNLERLLENLAASYLRGARFGSREGKVELCEEIRESAAVARNAGKQKAVDKVKEYRPAIFFGLPQEYQREFERLRDEALSE